MITSLSFKNSGGRLDESGPNLCRVQGKNTSRSQCAIFYKYFEANKLLKYVLLFYKYA